MSKKIWIIVGTRPEVIKQTPLYWSCKETFGESVQLVGTGQHKELLDQALDHFNETLSFNLELQNWGKTLTDTTGEILIQMGHKIREEKPDAIIVQGDTASGAMVAMAAFFEKVPVYHNEAGLRSYDLQNPFPEEANRKWISVVADHHFTPTNTSKQALLNEGVQEEQITVTGNTGIDALLWTLKQPCEDSFLTQVKELKKQGRELVFITSHRRENKDQFKTWFESLASFSQENTNLTFILPLHPNNLARNAAEEFLTQKQEFIITDPLPYGTTCHILKECSFVVTDSGGIQEECATLGVPTVVCRKTTERMEAIELGIAKLTDPQNISTVLSNMQWAYELSKNLPNKLKNANPYGDGKAGQKIAEKLKTILNS